ncbi:oxidoreductase, short chain dehydrogenase/reductase family [Aspergillus clavatus NRRL 1]|uniref:Oxidoreductase, short chain dehydrogenase/reductase family n=1 Tax=Aspergillus clavatus (strain ATCC 1007 / CBS 513.65 / DSM 816 / NCTC 3887 / NRRL 1 / QM 1276 / 107) TaxID=344612 RepID=A1C4V0_ASPCL|nr:oxidoreductase, short chain dehydrogenase/reductase family [Aspergillus clavatus NRRL 1]EAW14718.1 oxidoreductase, short chain dehydrogenase/reductase family [Aspergillus clavatus NRRL 1]
MASICAFSIPMRRILSPALASGTGISCQHNAAHRAAGAIATYRNFSSSPLHRDPEPFKDGKDPRTPPTASSPEKAYPNFSLRDKAYVITGGGRGLGLVIAEAMVQAGAKVHCFDRLDTPHPDFALSQEASKNLNSSIHYHHVDVRDRENLNKTICGITEEHGQIDGLVAAAGIQRVKDAVDHTPEDVAEVMDVNFTGVFMSANAVAQQMMATSRPGSIVLVASMSGMIANKGLVCPAYNASKAAVIQLTRNLAMEWGKHGIRVNALCPGHIVTPMV